MKTHDLQLPHKQKRENYSYLFGLSKKFVCYTGKAAIIRKLLLLLGMLAKAGPKKCVSIDQAKCTNVITEVPLTTGGN